MMAAPLKDWTDERIRQLRTLWTEGHSTEEIGRRMGTSKNAIVGKAHRLKLPARPSPIRRQDPRPQKLARHQGRKPSLPPLPALPMLPGWNGRAVHVQPITPRPVPVAPATVREASGSEQERRSGRVATCCWPIGEPGRSGFGFCGHPVMTPNRPYCEEHCDLAYVKKTVRRRDLEEDAHALS